MYNINMANLNTSTSVVDFLRNQGKSSDFNSRKSIYDTSGLNSAFGDYRGTAEQNTTLLGKLQRSSSGMLQTPTGSGDPGMFREPTIPTDPGMFRGAPPTAKDVVNQTSPSTISTAFDLEKSDAEKQADIEKNQASMDLGAETTRAAEGLQRGVNTLKRTAGEGVSELGLKGTQLQERVGEESAGFGGAFSGKTKKSQAEIAQEVATKQASIQAKLGDSLYNTFSDFEKNYGTEFLSKLSIPEASSFSKLPVAVRGIVMKNYQDAIQKAEEKAGKGTIDALDKLGYVVIGGQIIQKPSETRAEESAKRAGTTAEQDNYEYAKTQGFEGSYLDWKKLQATQYGTEDVDGGDSTFGQYKFTRNEIQSGAANAEVDLETFKGFSPESVNIFVNANSQINDKKKEIDIALDPTGTKGKKKTPAEIKEGISQQKVPQEVKDYLNKYLDNKVSNAPKESGKIGKTLNWVITNFWDQF